MPDRKPGTAQKHALAASMLGMLLDGYDLSIMAVVLLSLSSAWHLTAAQTGTLMAAALAGSFVGGLLGGYVTDRFGRRRLLLPNILLYGTGAVWSALSPHLDSLYAARFVTGLAIGLDYPLVATIVAEYGRSMTRGRGFAWINLAWFAGALVSTLVGWILLSMGSGSWRWMLGSAVVPVAVLFWLRRGLPESPRWLVRRGRWSEATEAMKAIRPELSEESLEIHLKTYVGDNFSAVRLLHSPWPRRLGLAIIPWFFLDVVSLGIALYFPLVLRQYGLAGSQEAAAAINALFLAISASCIVFILPRVDRWGRIPLQTGGFALMSCGLAVFGGGAAWHLPAAVYTGAALYAMGLGLGPAVTVFALSVEIFPTHLRATAAGMATAISRLGAVFSALFFPFLEREWGIAVLLLLNGGVALAAVIVTRLFALETRRVSLEELELPAEGSSTHVHASS